MSPLKIGTRDITAVKIGSRDIVRIMHGTREIWAADGGGGSEETGLAAIPGTLNVVTSTQQYGWQFTVGGNDLTVTKLRIYAPSAESRTLRLWDVTGTSLLGSVTVTSSADAWVEGVLSSPVTLSAGASYVVSERQAAGGSTGHYWLGSLTGYSFNPAITFVQSRSINGNGYPASTLPSSHGPRGIADIVFTL